MPVESVAQSNFHEFHLGDKVLVKRKSIKEDKWVPAFYAYHVKDDSDFPYVVFGGSRYSDCLPLEGNEGLVGTAKSAPGEPEPPKVELKQFRMFQEVEVNIYDDEEGEQDEHNWKDGWYISCSNDPDDMFPHKILLKEDTETYFVENFNIRLPKQN